MNRSEDNYNLGSWQTEKRNLIAVVLTKLLDAIKFFKFIVSSTHLQYYLSYKMNITNIGTNNNTNINSINLNCQFRQHWI
jgi:hypothetical protein